MLAGLGLSAMLVAMGMLTRLFDPSGFPARWRCGEWSEPLGWLHIVSDLAIFVAYAAIPTGLAVILIRRRSVEFPVLIVLFVAFILACGLTHATDALMFYHPIYRFLGLMKALTAVISLTTAVVLIGALPQLLGMPEIQRTNTKLKGQLVGEAHLRENLETARGEQERRSAQLTLVNRRITEAFTAGRSIALRWSIDDGVIDWDLGYSRVAEAMRLPAKNLRHWSDILPPEEAERLAALCREVADSGQRRVSFESVPPLDSAGPTVRLTAEVEPAVRGEPMMAIGLMRFM